MKVLVSIPAYNEEKTIANVIESIPTRVEGVDLIKILVIDDGSTDKTRAYAAAAGADVFSNDYNRGLSYSFQQCVKHALAGDFDIMVNIDADSQFNGEDIPSLINPILSNQADFVTGSRFADPKLIPKMPCLKKLGNKTVACLISWVAKKKFYDVSCGFRAYAREALLQLNLFSKFTYTHETFLNLIFKDLKILEVPVKVRGERKYGESKIAKSLWKYGYNIFNTIFRTILDYKPLKFFGWGGAILFCLGLILDIVILIRLLAIGEVTPYKTVGFAGLFLNVFGLMLLIIGLLADMINRVRMTQERLLYLQKKRAFDKNK